MKRNIFIFGILLSTSMSVIVRAEEQNSQSARNLNSKLNSQNNVLRPPGSFHRGVKNFVPQRQEFRKEMLEKFDANHDGKIDKNEREKIWQSRQIEKSIPEQ